MDINFNKWKAPDITDEKIAELYEGAKIKHKRRTMQKKMAIGGIAVVAIIGVGLALFHKNQSTDIGELTAMLRQETANLNEISGISDSNRISGRIKEKRYEDIF